MSGVPAYFALSCSGFGESCPLTLADMKLVHLDGLANYIIMSSSINNIVLLFSIPVVYLSTGYLAVVKWPSDPSLRFISFTSS